MRRRWSSVLRGGAGLGSLRAATVRFFAVRPEGSLVNSEPVLRWSVALYSCSVVVPWGAGESVVADVPYVSRHHLTMLLVGRCA
jgi:hypothetical protein